MNSHTRTNQWDLFKILVHAELVQRYQGSMLGFLWVFLKPLLLFFVLLGVFQVFAISQGINNYPLYLLLGILTFNFFSEGTTLGMNAILNKSHIIKKIAFDRKLAVLASVTHAGMNYLFSLLIFTLISFYLGNFVSFVELFVFVFHVIALALLIACISAFLSIVVVWFRDLSSIWEVLLLMLFYLTPVFYPVQIVPPAWRDLYMLNPLTILITNMRNILISHDLSQVSFTWLLAVIIGPLAILGYIFFGHFSKYIAEQI
ncbi:MAG: hypothetical protein A2V81_03160 [Candidatus Abawacabacteria bacterium RBG_16_42_10]|uniref:Transport permease protein n=1 Tax=Candidatus Abawacabacteria bacterium RBG_16_42_10 TaxID=1817814 RepID=A0A1F4XK86_9BACT|nr:MAG: hypothetical protein A2V81_03160 [Candidatus Abawacabacteria bacterium RBG_16_42_10]